MSWFYLALLPPLLFGFTNYIDKIILSRYVPNGAFGGLFILSATIGLPSVPLILLFTSADLSEVTPLLAILLILQGALIVLYLIPYFQALQTEEPSVVTPLFQMVPVFSLIIENFILGTTITNGQLLGMFLVISGSILISTDSSKRQKIQLQTFCLMALSCLILSGNLVLFKGLGEAQNFWTITCYSHLGGVLTALIFFIFHSQYRKDFISLISKNTGKVLSWNLINEMFSIIGGLTYTYCFTVLLAPVALVATISGIQPVVIFIIGIMLTFIAPHLHQEKLDKANLYKKIFFIFWITIGAVLIAFNEV